MSIKNWFKSGRLYILIFLGSVIGTVLILMLLFNIREKKREALQYPFKVVEIGEDEIDPAVWGQNFPFEYDTFVRTQEDYGKTKYGGSTPYSKLERYPAMKRLWAGYSFSKDHNEERGHHYTAIDQANTLRTKIVDQPGACVNCHAEEVPALVREMGWEQFNATPYNDLKSKLMTGSSCADCHMPYIRRGSVKISCHWIRSPLHNPNASCQTCHYVTVEEIEERVLTIQDRTAKLLRQSEEAILDAIKTLNQS